MNPNTVMQNSIRLGTRGSALALAQTNQVKSFIEQAFPDITVTVIVIRTEGDIDRSSPLSSFDGRGAFVKRIEEALLDGTIDAGVHSLKDLPSSLPQGLALGAVPVREDARDAVVTRGGMPLAVLPAGAVVGTGSLRRISLTRQLRDDLVYREIRGNVGTRLAKLDACEYDALILAAAGLLRLGHGGRITEYLPPESFVPAPCQGAIGVESRAEDDETLAVLSLADDTEVRLCVEAERAFIATLGLGCHAPVGAYAREDGEVTVFTGYAVFDDAPAPLLDTVRAESGSVAAAAVAMAERFKKSIGR